MNRRKGKMHNALCLFTTGSFLLLIVTGCSTPGYLVNWTSSKNVEVKRYNISDTDLTHFASALRPHKGDPDSLYQQACYFQDRKKHKLAVNVLKEITVIDPTYAKAYNAMGISYDYLGDFPSAIESYKTGLKLKPDLDYVHNNLGYSYLLQGELDAAIAAFQKAVALNGQNSRYHNNLGLTYAKKGFYDHALAEFRMAGDEAGAHYNMAQIYYQMGLYKKAKIHFSKASSAGPYSAKGRRGERAAKALAGITTPGQKEQMKDDQRQVPCRIETDKEGRQKRFYRIRGGDFESAKHEKSIAADANPTEEFTRLGGREGLKTPDQKNDAAKPNSLNEIEVEISNGNGVHRMAKRVGHYLRDKGLKVTRLTNADHFNFAETTIYYCRNYLQEAYNLAQHIPGYQNMEKLVEFDQQKVKIKVLIGKDLIPYDMVTYRPAQTS